MRNCVRISLVLVAGALLLAVPGCNSTSLDDGDSADVVLEVGQTTIAPVTAQRDTTSGLCTVTVPVSTSQLFDKPKNSSATTSPFNDIQLETLTISYTWDSASVTPTPTRQFPVAGVVPAGGSLSVQFTPIALGDVDQTALGHTALLTMTFAGRTISGVPLSAPVYGIALPIGSCQ